MYCAGSKRAVGEDPAFEDAIAVGDGIGDVFPIA